MCVHTFYNFALKFPLNVKCFVNWRFKMCQNSFVFLDQELYMQSFDAKIHPNFFKSKLHLMNEENVLYIINLVFWV